MYVGLARAHVPSVRLPALVDDLAAADWSGPETADAVIARHAADPGPAPLAGHRQALDRCFGAGPVEAIVAALEAEGGEWAAAQLAAIHKGSPTSLKLTLRQLETGAGMALDDCLRMEYRLSQACMAGRDFYEGVRALLVDKDKAPRWNPATLAGVDDALIERHFAFRPEYELTFPDGDAR